MGQTAETAANVATRLIDRHVQANLGHKCAFEFGGNRYTYHDLAALANRAGNLLKSLGTGHGARVLVLLPGSPAYLATMIGAMKIGAVPTIVSDAGDAAGVKACVEACKPVIAVVHQDYLTALEVALASLGAGKVLVVGQAAGGHPSFVEGVRSQPSSLAAESIAPDSPVLAIAAGGAPVTVSLRELEAVLEGGSDPGLGRLAATLQTLAGAGTVQLP